MTNTNITGTNVILGMYLNGVVVLLIIVLASQSLAVGLFTYSVMILINFIKNIVGLKGLTQEELEIAFPTITSDLFKYLIVFIASMFSFIWFVVPLTVGLEQLLMKPCKYCGKV